MSEVCCLVWLFSMNRVGEEFFEKVFECRNFRASEEARLDEEEKLLKFPFYVSLISLFSECYLISYLVLMTLTLLWYHTTIFLKYMEEGCYKPRMRRYISKVM